VDLARHVSERGQAGRILEAARPMLEKSSLRHWPRRLRPLGMLAVLARRDARRGAAALGAPASRGRLLRVFLHQMTGR